jgi:hypothetical protein
MLSSGLIQDISGTTEVPPSGDVNLFEVTFTFKSGVSNTPATVFASANDYVVGYDPVTQAEQTIGPQFIESRTCTTCVPEPSTWAMMALGFGGLGFVGYRKGRRALSAA